MSLVSVQVSTPKPIISIIFAGGDRKTRRIDNVYLSVNGRNVYDIGVACGTCPFLFNRKLDFKPALSADEITEILRDGLTDLNPKVISSFAGLLETDEYLVGLTSSTPKYINPNLSDEEKEGARYLTGYYGAVLTEHYQGRKWEIDANGEVCEIILPLTSTKNLALACVEEYKQSIMSGKKPTVVAYSYVESRHPAVGNFKEMPDFAFLVHFIIDGHHKLFAAAALGQPITILSFLSKKHSGVVEYHREIREKPMLEILKDKAYG